MLWLKSSKLNSKNLLERRQAAEELGRAHNAQAVMPLIDALKDEDWGVRKAAAEALGRIRDPRALVPLSVTVKDPDSSVAGAAVKALGEIGDPAALELLLKLFMDVPFPVLLEIRDTLGKLDRNWKTSRPARAAIQTLVEELRDPEASVRLTAAEALSLVADARATEALIAALQDPDALVRPWAAAGLGKTRDRRALEPLAKALRDPSMRSEAVSALREIGDPAATPALTEALAEAPQAVEVLGEIGDARAVGALVRHFLQYKGTTEYRNNPNAPYMERADASRPIDALQRILERHAREATLEDLQSVAALQNRGYSIRVDYDTPAYGDGADDYYVEIDTAVVRQLAQQEMERRKPEKS
jgi:HEAT repeat protein